MRVVGANDALRVFAGTGNNGEQPLRRVVHERDLALLIGHDDGVRHRVDQEVQPIALGANLAFRGAQPGVVLVDLSVAWRRSVMFLRIDTMPAPSWGSLTTVLRSSKSRSDPSVGSTSSSSRRPRFPFAQRGARQRRGKKHVVQLDGPAPPLAHIVRSGEQQLGARVGDDQLPVHVGEHDGIGGRVDDVKKQRVLAPKARILFHQPFARRHAAERERKGIRHPADRGMRWFERRADQHQTKRGIVLAASHLDGGEWLVAEQRDPRVARPMKRHHAAVGKRVDQADEWDRRGKNRSASAAWG
jgi:hypothetical protein